jgi:hypothetical protein
MSPGGSEQTFFTIGPSPRVALQQGRNMGGRSHAEPLGYPLQCHPGFLLRRRRDTDLLRVTLPLTLQLLRGARSQRCAGKEELLFELTKHPAMLAGLGQDRNAQLLTRNY